MTKHLYIHIPFCKSICTYCDFKRFVSCQNTINAYINDIIKQINKLNKCFYETIYIGGGTPNSLDDILLEKLLLAISKIASPTCETTIELNPEFVNKQQVVLFKKFKINRVSLGMQTTNDKILKKYNRHHTFKDCINAINLLYKNNINNVSLDFIYGFNELENKDIVNAINFCKKHNIKHVSFYSLEVKEGSVIAKNNYKINDIKIEQQLKLIECYMKKNKYIQYEVSNWCVNKKYMSNHNLCYWNTCDWKAIGYGSWGLEDNNYYHYGGSLLKQKKINKKLNMKDYYFMIISMGLRLTSGIDLKIKNNLAAYNYFKKKIENYVIIKNGFLICTNINMLNELLINIL